MAPRAHLDTIALNLRVPRGKDAWWREILELDRQGPWTIRDLVMRSNVSTRSVSQFVQALRGAGYVEVAETTDLPRNGWKRHSYRLLKHPVVAPRFSQSGEELPETQIETLWRTMKMAKSFTTTELVTLATTEARPITYRTARYYVGELTRVGILRRQTAGGPGIEARFALVRNLGSRAPMVLQARIVFDPNANTVVGEAAAKQVSP